jgi:hypothetical protein
MKFKDYLERKTVVESNEHLYEFSGDEATRLDIGPFSWGGGNELESVANVVAAGTLSIALLAAKSVYNRTIYTSLKSSLKPYIEAYKNSSADRSKYVFDHKYKTEVIEPLKAKTKSSSDDEDKSAVTQIEDEYREMIKRAEGNSAKQEQLRKQRDQKLAAAKGNTENAKKELEKAENMKEVAWKKAENNYTTEKEKIEKKQEKFIELQSNILGSSFKKKWDLEFAEAKRNADIEVLEEAIQIATDTGDKKTSEELKNKLSDVKDDENVDENVDEQFEKANKQIESLNKYGITQWQDAYTEYTNKANEVYKKWVDIEKAIQDKQNKTSDKSSDEKTEDSKTKELKDRIESAEEKIKKAEEELKSAEEAGDEEKAKLISDALEKAKQTVDGYKEELKNMSESISFASFRMINFKLSEAINLIIEETESKDPLGTIKSVILKSINSYDGEDKKKIATEGITDLQKIKQAKINQINLRNRMVELVNKGIESEDEEMPDEAKAFKEFPKLEPEKDTEAITNAIQELKDLGGEEKEPEEKTSDVKKPEEDKEDKKKPEEEKKDDEKAPEEKKPEEEKKDDEKAPEEEKKDDEDDIKKENKNVPKRFMKFEEYMAFKK